MTKKIENVDEQVFHITEENYNYTQPTSNYLRTRNRTTSRQLAILENVAQETLKPNKNTRIKLGEELGMTPRQVQIWFQNKRAKLKKNNHKDIFKRYNQKMDLNNQMLHNKFYMEHSQYKNLNNPELFRSSNNFFKDPYEEYTDNNLYNNNFYPRYFNNSMLNNDDYHSWQENLYNNGNQNNCFYNNDFEEQPDYQNFFPYNNYSYDDYIKSSSMINTFVPSNNNYDISKESFDNKFKYTNSSMFGVKKENIKKEFKSSKKNTTN